MRRGSPRRGNTATERVTLALLVIVLLSAGSEFFVPLTLAVLLSFMVGRGLRLLASQGLSARLSVAVLSCAVISAFVLGAWLMTSQLTYVSSRLPQYRVTIHQKMVSFETALHSVVDQLHVLRSPRPTGANGLKPQLGGPPAVNTQAVDALGEVQDFAPWLLHYLAVSAFVLVLAMFLAVYRDDVRDRIIRLAGHGNVHLASELLDELALKVSSFLWAQLLLNALFGLVTALLFYLLGIQYAALWGTMLGLLRFIPFVGIFIGAAMPVFFALATSPTWAMAGEVLATILVCDFLLAQFIEPHVIGSRIGLSPAAVLISAFAWTCLWGPAGLILATPLTTCLVVAGRYIPRLAFTSILFSDEQALTPSLQLYHRALSKGELSSDPWLTAHVESVGAETFISESFLPALGFLARDFNRGRLPRSRFRQACAVMKSVLPHLEAKLQEPAQLNKQEILFLLAPAADRAEALAARALAFLGSRLGGTWQVLDRDNGSSDPLQVLTERKASCVILTSMNTRSYRLIRSMMSLRQRQPDLPVLVYQVSSSESVSGSSTQSVNYLRSPREFLDKASEILSQSPAASRVMRS